MNPWVIILLAAAGIVFVTDYVFRRKKWNDNSKIEKVGLLVNMFSVGPYIFLSVLGMLWGIVPGSPKTAFGKIVYDVTLMMGTTYFIVAFITVILSLFLRKKGKVKASIWVNVVALLYILIVLTLNSFVGKVL